MENYEICKDCKKDLIPTKNPRTKQISCSECKVTSQNYQMHKLYLDCKANSQPELDVNGEELMFEDIKTDIEENIYFRNRPKRSSNVSSSLGDGDFVLG